MIWYGDFGSHFLGMLDPKTGKVVDYPMPITKPGAPVGALDLVLDKQGDIWMGTMYQATLAKFDRKRQKFQTWSAPNLLESNEAPIAMVTCASRPSRRLGRSTVDRRDRSLVHLSRS